MFSSAKVNLEDCDEDFSVSEGVQIFPSFKKMGLKPELLRGIYDFGFEKPSLVQQRAISQIIKKRDVVVQAQSGTGKTATFCIGTLQLLDPMNKKTQALFLAPTRELASQIHQVVTGLADHLSIKCMLCCGGKGTASEMGKTLNQGSQIVVGTPGRILELMRNGFLKLSDLRIMVVDEADEMLNQGLRDQLESIFKRLPSSGGEVDPTRGEMRLSTQRVVVSATWTSGCREVMQPFLDNPVCILVPRDELSLSGITQYYINTGGEEWKFETLTDIFASICVPQTVVFANTRRKVDWLSEKLQRDGFTVTAAHGDLNQETRDHVMKEFRAGRSRVLVTTDIWARGIDVQTVGLVVNYDLPQTAAVYLHRIGRSGRFGRRGVAISFVGGDAANDDIKHLAAIAKTYSITIGPAPANLGDLTNLFTGNTPSQMLSKQKKDEDDKMEELLKYSQQSRKKKKKKKNHKITELENQLEKKPLTELKQMKGAISASKKRKLKLKKNKKRRQKLAARKHAGESLTA
ncbi:unnamed protein product [Hymenolepis diminuta]|uniref:RNA helicase n=2 Tax=Hymenolepis diminuta TaxID=6216 RepID=A0A158QCQ4_HYMDI|nr:unnamed protein product [Hymenolepis diminuta]